MNLKDFLDDCQQEKIIDQSTVDQMYAYFQKRQKQISSTAQSQQNQNRSKNGLNITLGVIGVVLIGFGIIYLFAHNWDQLSRSTKTILSLIPVLVSIAANVFTITKRNESVVWQESSAISSFLAVGSMLALILQIYQLPGIENYFFTYWCVLCLPIIYLLQSHCAVVFAMGLMLLNLTSNPVDQSSLIEVPWFQSILLFGTLIPYLKRLFTVRSPESIYVLHQLTLPLVVCLSISSSIQGTHSSIWLIIFLLLANFHLFGTSVFLRKNDRSPNLMSILSYIGVSLSLSYLLFNQKWDFVNILKIDSQDFRLNFIPVLLIIGLFQLALFYKKEKLSVQNAYKLVILFPLPFVIMDFFEIPVFSLYQLSSLVISFVVVYFALKRKDLWQLYPALGFITMIIFTFIFTSDEKYALFYFSLISSLYYLVPSYLDSDKQKNTFSSNQIIILSFQFLILLIASFESFWGSFRANEEQMPAFQILLIILVCIGILAGAFKAKNQLMLQFSGLFGWMSILLPLFIFIGCISNYGIQHLYTAILLGIGIISLIYSAKQSNLTIANLSIGLIGLVLLCRFFDLEMSLTVKGILFILIGSCFFLANYLIIKNKNHENN